MSKHGTLWTTSDHAKHNAEETRRKLEEAQFNGFKTAREWESAQAELYAALNSACDTRIW